MRNILLFLVYALVLSLVVLIIFAGFTSIVWLPLFFIQSKAGFVIGGFITATTTVITKLAVDNNL